AQAFAANGNDSDFGRDTRRLTLPQISPTGFLNISAGFVRLPEISTQDVVVTAGHTVSVTNILHIFMAGDRTIYEGYEYLLNAPVNAGLAQVTGSGTRIAAPGATAPAQAVTVTVQGLAVGETTAALTVFNRLGDEVTVAYNIKVVPDTVDIEAIKVWAGDADALGMRPDSVRLQLWRRIEGGQAAAAGPAVTVSGTGDSWPHTFEDMHRADGDNNPYLYELRELDVDPNYIDTYGASADGRTFTVTNTYGPDATVRVRVDWDHTGAPDADKPASATVHIHRDGAPAAYASQVVDAQSGWSHTFEVPLVDYNGAAFTVSQNSLLPRYATAYATDGDVLVVKNTYVMPVTGAEVTIDWADDSDALRLRPANAFIRLYRNIPGGGREAVPGHALRVSGAGNRWMHTFEDMPAYDLLGRPYTYTVEQENLNARYSESIIGLAITNTLLSGSPRLEAVISSDVPNGTRVYENNVLTYTVTVRNTGEGPAAGLLIRDELHGALRFVSGSQSGGAQFVQENRTIGWIVPELAPGQEVTLSFRARVTGMEEPGSRLIVNAAEFAEGRPGADSRAELLAGDSFHRTNETSHMQREGVTITVRKIDAATGAPLAGAEFVLRQVSAYAAHDEQQDLMAVTGDGGEAVFRDVPVGSYTVTERRAPAGYVANSVRRSVDVDGSRAERMIVVPNRRLTGILAQSDFFDDEELEYNWGALQKMVMDVGVPNIGAGSRNVGDAPQ
ncbi:MAG: Cna B-type domain-containing protein, partial [Clostridia bacterium]|nr:Cna B-type domain-containing protein [Clostridia bacterium]